MRKAVFFDRDGTLNNNQDTYYIWKVEDFKLNPGVIETLSELKKQGYLLIVITNQGGVAKEEYNLDDVEDLHHHMCVLLEKVGIDLDEIYTCPHHHEVEACLCRKPLPLLIEKAIERYDIDIKNSWLVGDSYRDVKAGEALGLHTILVESNSDIRQVLDRIIY
jgi:D-glycero-D-manno-heptose 1,7-bisphosphate phosphatase